MNTRELCFVTQKEDLCRVCNLQPSMKKDWLVFLTHNQSAGLKWRYNISQATLSIIMEPLESASVVGISSNDLRKLNSSKIFDVKCK